MSIEATKEMCYYAFETLENKVTGSNKNEFSSKIPKDDKRRCPLFVTWKKNGMLRGCIGNFSDLDLWEGLRDYALIAGTEDPRFPPIDSSELSQLDCGISLLHSFEYASDCFDWEVGKHGIRLFIGPYRSTYLP